MPNRDITFTAVFNGATRKGASTNGNPTWTLHTSEGDYVTKSDGQIGYSVENYTHSQLPSSLIGKRVRFTASPAGRVWKMEEAPAPRTIRVAVRDEYSRTFGRQNLTLWDGTFASGYVGSARELPNGEGFMVTLSDGTKIRVPCPAPRTDKNFDQVDAAIISAINEGGRR